MDQLTSRARFHADLARLKQDIVAMGATVRTAVARSIEALATRNLELAGEIVAGDEAIDAMELSIEQDCLNLLALQQPMARDLRRIGTMLKIITDLERMADHAHDIAKITLRIGDEELIKPLVDIPRMAEITDEMMRDALQALIEEDTSRIEAIARRDDELDGLFRRVFDDLVERQIQDRAKIMQATHLIFVGQHLERIGDHATNIAEWVLYMVTGERRELND